MVDLVLWLPLIVPVAVSLAFILYFAGRRRGWSERGRIERLRRDLRDERESGR